MRQRSGDTWADATIATTTATEQTLVTVVGGFWGADITPEISHADDVRKVLGASMQDRAEAFRPVVRVLNPRIHSSESIDCATCHIDPDVAVFVRGTQKLFVENYPEHFVSRYPLDSATKSDFDAIGFENMHMLSYLGTTLNVSPRVANETAAILEMLNAE